MRIGIEGFIDRDCRQIPCICLTRTRTATGGDCFYKCLRHRGEVGITHPVNNTVGGCGGFCIKAEVEHIGKMILLLQYSHIGISCLREMSAADQHVKTNCPTILHDKATHVTGILDTFKGDDALTGLNGSNGVVTCVAGTRSK